MGSGILERFAKAVLVPLDELAMLDSTECVNVATILVSLGSAAALMGVDAGTGEDEGGSCNAMEKDVEDIVTALVLMLVGLMLSGWTDIAIEVAAEG